MTHEAAFRLLLKEVARGRKGARDLNLSEAQQAAQLLISGTASAAQTGAFFASLRIKTESVDELRAFSDTLREQLLLPSEFAWHDSCGLDAVGPFDGRSQSLYATIGATLIVHALGLPILLQGLRTALPPKKGLCLADVLLQLGISLPSSPQATRSQYGRLGISFADIEMLCPPLKRLRPLREELGFRTLLNTVEKTLNPSRNQGLIIGVYHRTQLEPIRSLASSLSYSRVLIVQGTEGSEDIYAHRPSVVWRIVGRHAEEHTIDPRSLNLSNTVNRAAFTLDDQREMLLSILAGDDHPYRDIVVLNAAVRLWLMDRVASWQEGVEEARYALDRHLAWESYNRWRSDPGDEP